MGGDVGLVKVGCIVLILLPGLIFASVASLAKGEVEVVTVIADPVPLTWQCNLGVCHVTLP